MKSLPLALIIGLCGSAAAFSQQAPTSAVQLAPSSSQNVAQPSSVSAGLPQACPVSITAKQAGATEMLKVKNLQGPDAERLATPGQRIRLFLSGLAKTGKVTATVTVRGFSARGRIDKAASADSSNLRRTLNVAFAREDEKTVWAELVLPGFTAVKSIKLEALEFADGTTRDLAGASLCTVAPDPVMLIAGK